MPRPTDSKFYLGIEATGRTVALLAGEKGEILGRGTAGPSVYSTVGQERSGQALWAAIIAAFDSAGFNTRDLVSSEASLPEVTAVCVAMSGIERPKDEAAVRRIVATFNLSSNIIAIPEARGVLLAGTADGFGVAVLAGDNGQAYAYAPDGRNARAGGWNFWVGEEGSAHYIGLQAVRAVLQAADGRGIETALTPLLAQEWKLPENRPDLVASQVYKLATGPGTGGNKAQIEETVESYKRTLSALAPLVERSAAKGDEVARQILDDAAEHLAVAAEAVIDRTELANQLKSDSQINTSPSKLTIFELAAQVGLPTPKPTNSLIPFALYGSALSNSSGELRVRLSKLLPQCREPEIVTEPAGGALKLALSSHS